MPTPAANEGYFISRSTTTDAYGLWSFQPNGAELLMPVLLNAGATFDRRDRVICIGGYLLAWGPSQPSLGSPYFNFRLIPFNPASTDPLSGTPLQHGQWSKEKFWGQSPDFGNPSGGHKQFQLDDNLNLISLGTFVMNFIPTAGRGTYAVWSFDPCPTGPGTADPLPGAYSFTAQGSFRDMQLGDELIPLNGYVLDRKRATNNYRLWSFDPQARNPLAHPAIQEGTWTDIGPDHELVPIGEYVLDWVPADRSYRLWQFNPKSANPLTGPLRSGTLPAGFDVNSSLMGFQPAVPIDATRAATPGTMDFMRSKIKHVVCYMLENRSFDHIVGWLYEGGEQNVKVIGPPGPYDGASTKYFNFDGDKKVYLSKYMDGKLSTKWSLEMFQFDPYHDNSDVLRQFFFEDQDGYAKRAVPNMGGFVWNNSSDQVMLTYSPEQVPVLNGIAKNFAISDRWFCGIPSSTDANRAFALTGSSMMELNNFMEPPQYIYWPEQPHRPSIFKLLWANGLTDWTIYNSTEWMNHVFTYELFLEGQVPTVDTAIQNGSTANLAPVADFYAQAAAGTLPAFSYIEPIWIGSTGTTSYHPGEDLIPGEVQLNKVYNSLRNGPNWDETLLIVTFDEHGGIFDHVAPPYAENPWPNDVNDGFRYDLMGPRVPTIIASPWVQEQTIFRSATGVEYDATSFTATLLEWFGIPRARWFMGERAKHAPTFENVLTLTEPRKDSPAFTPPYDINYPPNAPATPTTDIHGLHLHMAHQIVSSMARGKLPPAEIARLSHDIASGATDIVALTKRLNDLEKKLG